MRARGSGVAGFGAGRWGWGCGDERAVVRRGAGSGHGREEVP